jgi:hypothetical protein
LDFSGSSEVRLAENPKTHEVRVFKFEVDGGQFRGLKRELTGALPARIARAPDFVRVLE